MQNSKKKPKLLRRAQASQYLQEVHGLQRSPATLASDACRGTGAEIVYVNGIPYYQTSRLDAYAKASISEPTTRARKYPQARNPRNRPPVALPSPPSPSPRLTSKRRQPIAVGPDIDREGA
jgi:hypothetical protein